MARIRRPGPIVRQVGRDVPSPTSGDYGLFAGCADADSFSVAHFDGAFVYLLTGRLTGDTLRGIFHAGLRTQTPFVAVRSTGKPHLVAPTELTRADTTKPFQFAFPDLTGRLVTNDDARFKGQVVVIDIFGSWCPTCHDAVAITIAGSRWSGSPTRCPATAPSPTP